MRIKRNAFVREKNHGPSGNYAVYDSRGRGIVDAIIEVGRVESPLSAASSRSSRGQELARNKSRCGGSNELTAKLDETRISDFVPNLIREAKESRSLLFGRNEFRVETHRAARSDEIELERSLVR